MRTFDRRLRRLETVTVEIRSLGSSPAEVLKERIRRRYLAEGKPPPEPIPKEVFSGCRRIGETILRARKYRREREQAKPQPPTLRE